MQYWPGISGEPPESHLSPLIHTNTFLSSLLVMWSLYNLPQLPRITFFFTTQSLHLFSPTKPPPSSSSPQSSGLSTYFPQRPSPSPSSGLSIYFLTKPSLSPSSHNHLVAPLIFSTKPSPYSLPHSHLVSYLIS